MLTNEDLLTRTKDQSGQDGSLNDENDIINVGECTYIMGKAKMLIRNFLILRVLITNIVLSPWHHGVGPKPLPKQKKVIDNLRMAASMFYAMLKIHQPKMAHIVVGYVMTRIHQE
jgi:hypothetical protein